MSYLDLDTDVKPYLRIPGGDADVELQFVINSAEAAIGRLVGPLVPEAVTETVHANPDGTLLLACTPVASITSITPYSGTALDVTALDTTGGVVSYLAYGSRFYNTAPLTVVYQAGWTSLPADLKLAALELVRHLWTTQRGSGNARPRPQNELSTTLPGAAYSFPIRVEQLLAPYRLSGFA